MIERNLLNHLVLVFLICLVSSPLSAQEKINGIINYDQMEDYKLEGVYDDPRWSSYIAGLPKTGDVNYILTFSPTHTIYVKKQSQAISNNRNLQLALKKANYMKAPKPEAIKVYNDYNGNQRTEQIEFMTKDFLIASDIKQLPWKLTLTRKQVLDYECMGAEIKEGDETITAYFSPEIPISIGPGKFYGLPGAILSVEKNGIIVIQATSIQLGISKADTSIEKPIEGKKMSKDEFDKLVEKKMMEYKENKMAKSKNKEKKTGKK